MTEVKVRIRFAQFILKARKRFVCLILIFLMLLLMPFENLHKPLNDMYHSNI